MGWKTCHQFWYHRWLFQCRVHHLCSTDLMVLIFPIYWRSCSKLSLQKSSHFGGTIRLLILAYTSVKRQKGSKLTKPFTFFLTIVMEREKSMKTKLFSITLNPQFASINNVDMFGWNGIEWEWERKWNGMTIS